MNLKSKERYIKNALLISCISLLSCVTIPNIKICSVAGVMSAGVDCAWTLSPDIEEMDLDQFIDFLEPTDERAGAMVMSADHWLEIKTTIDQLCRKLENRCKKETRAKIKMLNKNLKKLRQ